MIDICIELELEFIDDESVDVSKFIGVIVVGIGGIMGIIMYIVVFIYGMMVMCLVMEEKISCIVEVMIFSVCFF